MSEAGAFLRRAADVFRNSGISNDVRIAEHVAFLLLIRSHWDELRQFAPRTQTYDGLAQLYEPYASLFENLEVPAPPPINFDTLLNVLGALEAAVNASPYGSNLGQFFQREIRFELLKSTSGSQYPTPHHIATFMAQLAVTSTSARAFDPTAGTGGLLVAAHTQNENTELLGVDFDSQWVALASANLVLNGATYVRMEAKQALELHDSASYMTARSYEYYKDQWEYRGEFDAVLMNPPFGGTRNPYEVGASVGTEFGRTSSTVLAALALRMLKIGGIAAFLQPSGVLFGSSGEAHLRHVLMHDYVLEAVVTLPPDAMQPYSQVAAHLLVARNAVPEANYSVWFLTLISDGYPAGTARDLTAEPNATQSDFLRARDLVLKSRADQWITRLTLDGIGDVQTIKLGDELPGLGIRVVSEPQDIKWSVSHLNDGVLVKLRNAEDTLLGWFYEPYYDSSVLSFVANGAQQFDWKHRLSHNALEINEHSTWLAGSDNVTVEVNPQGQQITLQRDRTKFDFSLDNGAKLMASACLLNVHGKQITPWFDTTNEKIKESDFGESVGATGISNAVGEVIGWLLDLTLTENGQEQQSTLLIITELEAELFTTDRNTYYALIVDGWLEVKSDGSITVRNGSPVRLRDEVTKGFAIGPAALSEEVSHSLFGVLVPSTVFVRDGKVGDMRPSSFLPEPESTPLGHPLDVLASIRRSQVELADKVDTLLGILGHLGQYSEEAELPAEVPTWIKAMLGSEQKRLLVLLTQQLAGQKPRHFTQSDLIEWCDSYKLKLSGDDVQQQMTLFLRLGLVKEVNIDGKNYYRMVTRGDIAQPAGESS